MPKCIDIANEATEFESFVLSVFLEGKKEEMLVFLIKFLFIHSCNRP